MKTKSKKPKASPTQSERWLSRKWRIKRIRAAIQIVGLALLAYLLVSNLLIPKRYDPGIYTAQLNSAAGDGFAADGGGTSDSHFICIAYSGLTKSTARDSSIVSQQSFDEQMAALHASGYITITQQDILDYYLYGSALPEKSMLLLFEDGILNTATLAQPALEKYNYIATMCTYSSNLTDIHSKFVTTESMKKLLKNSYWEMGSNGHRLSYINIFDRYGNYFGNLNTNEFVNINQFLKRDYNHYLMDFYRDEDYLRLESPTELQERFGYDYEQMAKIYEAEIGYIPALYVLMHSNTGAFGTDQTASDLNRDMLTSLFAMNFNRQGSCLNTRASSVYDLSRLQVQPFFSTNQLLMRMWDDTGEDMKFVTGDTAEAAKWYQDVGVAEYRQNEIILTSLPYGEGRTTLGSGMFADVEASLTLNGNSVGVQSIYLRTDRSLSSGVQVSLENNELVVRDLGAASVELFRQNLFDFDGGAQVSQQEDELSGLIAYHENIIRFDEDAERIEKSHEELKRLSELTAINLEEGGTPYIPDIDISQRDSRHLRIRLVGKRISIWLDNRSLVENLSVSSTKSGSIALGSAAWWDQDNFSQKNIVSDVYDARFVDILVTEADDPSQVLYSYRLTGIKDVQKRLSDAVQNVVNFFLDFL